MNLIILFSFIVFFQMTPLQGCNNQAGIDAETIPHIVILKNSEITVAENGDTTITVPYKINENYDPRVYQQYTGEPLLEKLKINQIIKENPNIHLTVKSSCAATRRRDRLNHKLNSNENVNLTATHILALPFANITEKSMPSLITACLKIMAFTNPTEVTSFFAKNEKSSPLSNNNATLTPDKYVALYKKLNRTEPNLHLDSAHEKLTAFCVIPQQKEHLYSSTQCTRYNNSTLALQDPHEDLELNSNTPNKRVNEEPAELPSFAEFLEGAGLTTNPEEPPLKKLKK